MRKPHIPLLWLNLKPHIPNFPVGGRGCCPVVVLGDNYILVSRIKENYFLQWLYLRVNMICGRRYSNIIAGSLLIDVLASDTGDKFSNYD